MAPDATTHGSLVEAAQGVAEALEQLDERIAKAVRTPLRSARQIEQVARALQQLPEAEARIRECLLALGAAFQDCGLRQERLLEQAQARALEVAARAAQLQSLTDEHERLVEATRGLSDFAREAAARHGPSASPDLASSPASAADLAELAARSAELVSRAGALLARAREAGFEDVARSADSMRQQLHALRKKIGASRSGPTAPLPD
jgi:hypothetical protein